MRLYALIALAVLVAATAQAQGGGKKKGQLKNQEEKTSYAIGLSIGTRLSRQGAKVKMEPFLLGLKDGMAGATPLLNPKEFRATMTALTKSLRKKQQRKKASEGVANLKKGKAFLAANKKKKGVVTLPSGLQYKIIKAGKGKKPKSKDTVVTHYRGKLLNGIEFDSSYARKKPATFSVGGVIAGWTEALQLMRVGAKWQLFIPSALAYKGRGSGPKIGPNATLIFDIELLKIK